MIKTLRQRHFSIWVAWMVLIPAGILAGWLAVRRPIHHGLLQPAPGKALPNILQAVETKRYTVRLRSNGTAHEQLEWINKQPLTVPTAVIYKANAKAFEPTSSALIGRIEAMGSYYFPLRADSSSEHHVFILYDFIHGQIIDTIKFQP